MHSFWVRHNAFDIYGTLIALIFLGGGLWLGNRFNQKSKKKGVENSQNAPFSSQNTEGGHSDF